MKFSKKNPRRQKDSIFIKFCEVAWLLNIIIRSHIIKNNNPIRYGYNLTIMRFVLQNIMSHTTKAIIIGVGNNSL